MYGARSGLVFIGAILCFAGGCGSSGAVTGAAGSGAASSSASGSGGSTGSGGGSPDGGLPEIALGQPIQAPDGVWTDVPFPEGYCRDGTAAHLMVHLNSASQKFAIYLEGGGACFNDASCKLLDIDLPTYVLGQGIFNFTRTDNPIGDWNIFYVPYCTGDVHAGANPAGVPGPLTGPQDFTGYTNLELYLSRILATVPGATDELLTGSSAGGFGAGLTAGLVARNVPASVERFTLIDDSGQPMSSQYIAPCLQDIWRTVWGLDSTFLKECGAACPTSNDYVFDWMQYLLDTYAKGPFAPRFMGGLISWAGDAIISSFYGFGADNCTVTTPVPLTSAQFEAGLLGFRTQVQSQTSLFGTYFASGTSHTFLLQDSSGLVQGVGLLGGLYDTQVGGVTLVSWINDLLAHKQAATVGP
jgi:hypothetical protein